MKTAINFDWKFSPTFEKKYLDKEFKILNLESVDIPHTYKIFSSSYFNERDYQKEFTYFKEFEYNLKNKENLFLNFEAVMIKFKVYLNSEFLGEYISLYLPVKIDITSKVKKGKNRLIVVVDSKEDKTIPPFGGSLDYLTFAGIYRGVYLESVSNNYIEDVFVSTTYKGDVSIELKLHCEDKNLQVIYQVYQEDAFVKESNSSSFSIPSVIPYTLDHPFLYTLKIILKGKKIEDIVIKKIGFRSVKFTSNGFYLNEKKVKLIGLNRHQSYPYFNIAASKSLQEEDATILKELGINVVRTSHYPQSEDFLNACDKIGLFVIDEVPGWQYVSNDPTWRNNFLDFIRRMVIKERNHTCLIAYGVRIDESKDDESLYSIANKIAHEEDPTRDTIGVRNFKNSQCFENIYGYNDFSCFNNKHGLINPSSYLINKKNIALLNTENNGHMYPVKTYDNVERRKNQCLRYLRVLDDTYKYKRLSGSIAWCAFDYNTHSSFGSGNRICHHGVYDIFRNEKDVSYVYMSQFSKKAILHVVDDFILGDKDEMKSFNTLVLTNVDYIVLYKDSREVKRFYPDKRRYKHLPHPPIFIDDYIGKTFAENDVKKRHYKKIVKVLNLIGRKGIAHLNSIDKLYCGFVMLVTKLNYSKLSEYYGKYFSNQGFEKPSLYEIKGYKKGMEVISKKFSVKESYSYKVRLSKDELINEDSYDSLSIHLSYVDQNDNLCNYAFNPLQIKVKGPIQLLSPSFVSLEGGMQTIYVRSKQCKVTEIAEVIITDNLNNKINIKLSVN